MLRVCFDNGTLLVHGTEADVGPVADLCVRDERVRAWRAEAWRYAEIILRLHQGRHDYADEARGFERLQLQLQTPLRPRDYQRDAVRAWIESGRRGLIVLPTGSGKSYVARLVIAATARPVLVVVPTLDLMAQWATQLEQGFGCEVGLLGGGSRDIRPLTVSTYDSAVLQMEFIGNRFGLLIADECHHLPGGVYRQLAVMCIAPFRLGLSATPERGDEGDEVLAELMGPVCFRRDIDEMEGHVLSPYRTIRVRVELTSEEQQAYDRNRRIYTDFIRAEGISFRSARGWQQFLGACSRHPRGRDVFDAYLAQKRIARTSRAKFDALWTLMRRHAGQRIIVFTADNLTAYEIGRRFLLPVLTHKTKAAERKGFLDAFRAGSYPVLVTSRVLNEGVDVPEASVGVVVSGTGSIREHVQRLGRILRPVEGKQAVLYELISEGTAESYTSERRRQHRAYQRSDTMSS